MNTTLVLEIGNPWLKMAVFRSAINAYYLKAVSASGIAGLSEDDVAKSMTDYCAGLKLKKPQNIVVSFSRNAVTLRNLRIPSVNPTEIEDMIKLHVGRQVPYAKEEIVSGWRIIGRDTMGYSKVMLAIVHRESIRKAFRILEKAGLYTDSIELGSDGVLSYLCKNLKLADSKAPEAFVILDIDSNFTDFIVATYENILFSRVMTQGSDQLSDESKWMKFIGEMKQTLIISQGEEVLQKPAKIYLTGAFGKFKKIASLIETEFNLPVETVEHLLNLPLAKEVLKNPLDIFDNASFSPLLGLGFDTAKKKINFVLPEAQIRRVLRDRGREMIFFASCLMYLILVICGVYLEKLHNKEAYSNLVKDRYKKISTEAESLNEKVERIKRIKSKLDTKSSAINYIYEISNLLPSEIVATNLTFQKDDKVELKGYTVEMSDVFKFISTLEGSVYFKDVQSRYTTRKKIKGKDVTEFDLVCPVETDTKDKKAKK
jgi:Tfp pilus assembly PilM family ATPase/Tfp pilus assembly protein PilN